MSLIKYSGAEHIGSLDEVFVATDPGWEVNATEGHNGSPCFKLKFGFINDSAIYSVPTTSDTCYFGARIKFATLNKTLFRIRSGDGSESCALTIDASGFARVSSAGFSDTGTTTLFVDTYYYFELKVVHHASTGSYELRINETVEPNLKQDNNRDTEGAFSVGEQWSAIRLVGVHTVTDAFHFDDIYVGDAVGGFDFLGEVHEVYKPASGNGTVNQWTGSDADKVDNYLHVDENLPGHDSDTSYVQHGIDGEDDLYDIDLDVGGDSILALTIDNVCKKTETGSRRLTPLLRAGGTIYPQANITPTTAYLHLRSLLITNPATAAPFADTDVIEVGQRIAS